MKAIITMEATVPPDQTLTGYPRAEMRMDFYDKDMRLKGVWDSLVKIIDVKYEPLEEGETGT